jgi:hypothetical protein
VIVKHTCVITKHTPVIDMCTGVITKHTPVIDMCTGVIAGGRLLGIVVVALFLSWGWGSETVQNFV